MADNKISNFPLSEISLNSIIPFVDSGVTYQTYLGKIVQNISSIINTTDIYVTGGTYDNLNGIITLTNNSGITFSITGFSTGYTYMAENVAYKQDSLVYDGSGNLYPTVDAVNAQNNLIGKISINTGFIDVGDAFYMSRPNDFTLRLNPSNKGIIFKSLIESDSTIDESLLQIPLTDIPLSGISFTGDGVYVKFIGYSDSGIAMYSDATFETSNDICQLGILVLKVSGGTVSFLDSIRGIINKPNISLYSNLEISLVTIQSDVIVIPNSDLTVSNTNGNLKGMSVNWQGINNDLKPFSSNTVTSFTHLSYANALTPIAPAFTGTVDTTQYWSSSANSLVTLSTSGAASIQRWLTTINGTIALQYGEQEYVNLDIAKNNVSIATFLDVLPVGTYAEIGRMVAIRDTTDLSNINQCVFYVNNNGTISISRFTEWGYITGSLSAQTDLQAILDTKDPCPPIPFLDLGNIFTPTLNIPLNQGRNIKCSPKVNITLSFIQQSNGEGKKNNLIFNMTPGTVSTITYPSNVIVNNNIYRNVHYTSATIDTTFANDVPTSSALSLVEYSGTMFQVISGGVYKRLLIGNIVSNACITTFSVGNALGGAIQPDGKLLVFGTFQRINGSSGLNSYLARLNNDGCRDTTFIPYTTFNTTVNAVVVQSDGKIVAGGAFTTFSGSSTNYIVRMNTNNFKDATFNMGTGFNAAVTYLALQPNGKILVYGNFTTYNGSSAFNFCRLNTDGTLDGSFNASINNVVTAINFQTDGKILVGGNFTSPTNRIVRLNSSGSIDNTFNVGTGLNGQVQTITIQTDGKIVVGGAFTTYQGLPANRLIRLNTDGSLDNTFYVGTSFNNTVNAMILQPDNRVIVGGNFNSVNGNPNFNYVVKIVSLPEKNYVLNIIQSNNNNLIIT